MVELEVAPNSSIGADDFTALIGNQSYQRILEDSFLANHQYASLGHREIITKTSGWIVFEIPQSAEDPESWKIVNGEISVNLQQTDKNLVQQEVYNGYAARQAELTSQYQATFIKGEYTPENPYIIVNPYETAPLTALILFNTDMPVRRFEMSLCCIASIPFRPHKVTSILPAGPRRRRRRLADTPLQSCF